VALYVFHHRASSLDSFAQLVAADAQFLAPVRQLVFLIGVDSLIVGLAGLLQVLP
jgi:hypothetical protein